MHHELEELCTALSSISTSIKNNSRDTRSMTEISGAWHIATLTPIDLAEIPDQLLQSIKSEDVKNLSEQQTLKVKALTKTVMALQPTIIPQLFNGNPSTAMSPFMDTMNYISISIIHLLSWKTIKDKSALPQNELRRLESTPSKINTLIEGTSDLENKISKINDAYSAAEELPTTLDF